ncbi:uncharacterized protein LOC130686972 [Daphnia carinata]|uniref:uncharacterized protein LOC130686972 n=1 Tax=Daphnia carinata TaxID=120202 RepID=UPI00257E298A|nr:uncharacterized protein LOC130686972 [Daphnia carinata]
MAATISGTSMLVVSFEWTLENVEETKTVLSKMILFSGEKIFRVCLKKITYGYPTLLFLATNLNRMGMRVKEIRYSKQDTRCYLKMEEKEIKKEKKGASSLQLFTADLHERVSGNCMFTFSIWIEGSVTGYSYHISDRLMTQQLWNASAKQEHGIDVELVCKEKTFSAHKAILAARSPIFAAEFAKDHPAKHESGPHQIHVEDVEPSALEEFLYFVYTGQPKTALANAQLLKLASRYQLKTLENLCRAALTKIDVQQAMACMSSLNPAATSMHLEVKPSSSVLIRPNTEIVIDHDQSMSTFQCCWEPKIDSRVFFPNTVIEYQHEKLFSPHLTGNMMQVSVVKNPWIHLVCVNHRSFGFKALSGLYSTDGKTWIGMKTRKAKGVELFLFVGQTNETFRNGCRVTFCMEMSSTIENYHYELMDTSWTTQLWQSALEHKWTDVEIFVGAVKLEAHRVVLSARSPVLNLLLGEIDHLGRSSMAVEENIDVEVVKVFLKFLYTGRLDMSATNKQLLQLAESYEVETLLKICQLANRISPDVTSKLDALPCKVDITDKPAISFQMDLEVVNLFLKFLHTGSLDSSVSQTQLAALATIYETKTLSKVSRLVSEISPDVDKLTTFMLTFF